MRFMPTATLLWYVRFVYVPDCLVFAGKQVNYNNVQGGRDSDIYALNANNVHVESSCVGPARKHTHTDYFPRADNIAGGFGHDIGSTIADADVYGSAWLARL